MATGDTPEPDFGMTMRGAGKEQKLFGRYTLKRVLGRGGMGIVWLAHDDELIRYVAMKFLPDMLVRDREAVEDLKRETRRSLDLTHHHIVRIYDFTQDEMCAAIIMEFVDGETLSAMKTQQPGRCFGVAQIAPWVAHFASALDYAHRQARVIHRDLKPANLMINSRGDLKITDFGISRSMSDSMTRVSVSNTAGTLAYMSPEQALGAPPAPGDDIYAFGATVYDLLTGRPPFFRGNLQVQLETVTPPRMDERRAELGNEGEPIPELWQEVIAKCLTKRPNERPQSIAEVAAMLGLSGGSSTGGGPATSTGNTLSGIAATTRTRSSEDSATDGQNGLVTPRTSQPSTNRPTAAPRPTGLSDVLGATEIQRSNSLADAATAADAPQTIPVEDLTIYGNAPAPAAEASSPKSAPAAVEARSSTSTASKPAERKPSSGLALAAAGSLALVVAGGAWVFLKKGDATVSPKTTAPAEIATSAPNYEIQVTAICSLIDAERLDVAAEQMTKLPATLPALADLQAALSAKKAEIAKRDETARAMAEKKGQVSKLIEESDAQFAKADWSAARSPLLRILADFDPSNADAKTKLSAIEDAEKKAAMQRDEDAFRTILSSATAALAAGEFANAKRLLDTAPPSFAGHPEIVALDERIEKARIAALTPPPPAPMKPTTPAEPEPEPDTPKTAKTAPAKPKPVASQPTKSSRRDDDDDKPNKRPQSAPTKPVDRPAQPVVTRKEAPSTPPRAKSSINRGTNPGG